MAASVPPRGSWSGGARSLDTAATALSRAELLRYSRHLLLPGVSLEGQKRLKGASVLVVGAGALGAPVGLYLAAAGVGRLGVVDFDSVELSNLQRQILFSTADVGRPKVEAARERLQGLNPQIELVVHPEKLTSHNALELLARYDVVVDGSDNFPTRYLVNDVCVLLGKPNVHGSIYQFAGQVSVFLPGEGPCYRCLFPEPPPPELVPSCAEGGVLGVVPGIIGSLQALEALKLLLGVGEPLVGRLLLLDALGLTFRELKLRRDPHCAVCGPTPTITAPVDYEAFCQLGASTPGLQLEGVGAISAAELRKRQQAGQQFHILDVREPHEQELAPFPGAFAIPLDELPAHLHQLDSAKVWTILCQRSQRARQAALLLRQAGFTRLQVLTGGVDAWLDEEAVADLA